MCYDLKAFAKRIDLSIPKIDREIRTRISMEFSVNSFSNWGETKLILDFFVRIYYAFSLLLSLPLSLSSLFFFPLFFSLLFFSYYVCRYAYKEYLLESAFEFDEQIFTNVGEIKGRRIRKSKQSKNDEMQDIGQSVGKI